MAHDYGEFSWMYISTIYILYHTLRCHQGAALVMLHLDQCLLQTFVALLRHDIHVLVAFLTQSADADAHDLASLQELLLPR